MIRLDMLPIKGDTSKSLMILRATQASCSLVVCICVITLATQMYYGGGVLLISSAWGSAVMGVVAVISALLLKRPAEIWQLAFTLDAAALFCGLINIICLAVSCAYSIICLLPLFATLISTSAFVITSYRTFSLHRDSQDHTRSSDPLKPYLIKKEIDVWCYPVQLDGARTSKQYAMELFDLEQGSAFANTQPAPSRDINTGVAPTRDAQQVDAAKSQKPTSTIASPSVAETTAAWSVPSGNETYQPSQKAASTVLPSYAGPPSINVSQHSPE